MKEENRLPVSLLALRLTVFLVMLVWTLDKFIDVEHAASVYQHFYFIGGLGASVMYVIGAIELIIVLGFLLGIAKRWTYGAVLVFHAVSTFASFPMYFDLQNGRLFFAAWPMLAACLTLYLLRDRDTLMTAGR